MRKTGQSTEFIMNCIAEALLQLMREKDYDTISVSDICRRAGVGRTTFYRHFTEAGGKDGVLIFYAASLWNGFCAARDGEAEKDGWGALMNYIYENRVFYSALGSQQLNHILFSIFYKTMGPSEEDSPETAFFKSFFAGAVFGITYNWIETGFRKSPAELAGGIAELQARQA